MAKSRWKVRNGKKIQRFRQEHDITRCTCCGVKLFTMCHHYLCNACWDVKKNKPFEWKAYYNRTRRKYVHRFKQHGE